MSPISGWILDLIRGLVAMSRLSKRTQTIDIESFSLFRLDPLSIDICFITQDRWVFQLELLSCSVIVLVRQPAKWLHILTLIDREASPMA